MRSCTEAGKSNIWHNDDNNCRRGSTSSEYTKEKENERWLVDNIINAITVEREHQWLNKLQAESMNDWITASRQHEWMNILAE